MGSNRGDSLTVLRSAVRRLARRVDGIRTSGLYVSAPIGTSDQPDFLNACCVGRVDIGADALLGVLLAIEAAHGRRRPETSRSAARTLDLDLLLYGGDVIRRPGLTVPHPRLHQREFVLRPLAELIPDTAVPDPEGGSRGTVAELLEALTPQKLYRSDLLLEVP